MAAIIAPAAITACRADRVEQPVYPTRERLVASSNSIGIPYDRLVLLRYREQLIALEVTAVSQLGDTISYEWHVADDRGAFSSDAGESGGGETTERPFTGRIALPGPLTLEWSRGSTVMGWLYWPRGGPDFEVYSRSFGRLEDIDPRRAAGKWFRRDAFLE